MQTVRGISLLFRLAAAGVCLGVAATALRYDLPLRELLWDQKWWSWFAEWYGYNWKEWVTSPVIDGYISSTIKGLGVMLGLGGVLILVRPKPAVAIWVVFFILLLQHFLLWKEHFWNLGHLLEYGLQTAAPLLLLKWLQGKPDALANLGAAGQGPARSYFWYAVRVLIAVTFVGHGLYAIGYHPVPANFIFMTQAGLGVGEAAARNLLVVVGVLDFVAAGLLLVPSRKAVLAGLLWIIPWAILTTLARLWSYSGSVSFETLLWQWLPEVVRRLPHVLVPLALWRALRAGGRATPADL